MLQPHWRDCMYTVYRNGPLNSTVLLPPWYAPYMCSSLTVLIVQCALCSMYVQCTAQRNVNSYKTKFVTIFLHIYPTELLWIDYFPEWEIFNYRFYFLTHTECLEYKVYAVCTVQYTEKILFSPFSVGQKKKNDKFVTHSLFASKERHFFFFN